MARYGSMFRATATAVVLGATLGVGAAIAAGEDCPPNPEPGKCYEKVYLPAYDVYTGGGYSRARESSFSWREMPCRSAGGGASASGGVRRVADVRVATSPSLVRAVQSALMVEGYYSGPISGEQNPATEGGLARFQYDRGLAPGWTDQTLRALGIPTP